MAPSMQTFAIERIGEVDFTDKPVPEPGPNDAIVKTTRAFVCTSDVHTLLGGIGERADQTLGHEAVGVVAKLGGEVKGFREGDRVLVGAITPDFTCEYCQRGYTSQCRHQLGGWKFAKVKDGVFAEYQVLLGWCLAQRPYLVYPDLTFIKVAAPAATIGFLLASLPIGVALLAPSLWLPF